MPMSVAVTMVTVTVAVAVGVFEEGGSFGRVQEELRVERGAAAHAHVQAAEEQHARDAERSQALHLAEADRKFVGWRAQAPRDGREGEDIRGEIGQAVPGVGDQGLRTKRVAARALDHRHSKVRIETNAGDAHTRIVLVLGGQVGVIVVVVVAVVAVAAFLSGRDHDADAGRRGALEEGVGQLGPWGTRMGRGLLKRMSTQTVMEGLPWREGLIDAAGGVVVCLRVMCPRRAKFEGWNMAPCQSRSEYRGTHLQWPHHQHSRAAGKPPTAPKRRHRDCPADAKGGAK